MFDALMTLGSSLLSGHLNNQAAERRQEDAHNFSAQQFASRYQTTTADMKAAGLNPMLAYQQGGGNAPSGVATSSAGHPDLGRNLMQSKLTSAQVANMDADTANKQAQADLIQAQIAQTYASAGQATAQTGLVNQTVEKVRQEIANLKSEDDRLKAAADQLRKSADLMYKQGLNATEIGNNLRATLGQIRSQTDLLNSQDALVKLEQKLKQLDVSAGEAFGNLGREAAQFKPLFDLIKTLMRGGK